MLKLAQLPRPVCAGGTRPGALVADEPRELACRGDSLKKRRASDWRIVRCKSLWRIIGSVTVRSDILSVGNKFVCCMYERSAWSVDTQGYVEKCRGLEPQSNYWWKECQETVCASPVVNGEQ